MKRVVTNILRPFDARPAEEVFERIAAGGDFLFERIVSHGHATPPGTWYDQPRAEWVVLLSGAATLRFEGSDETLALAPGDAVLIPAHCRHRVDWTDPAQQSVWLALHFQDSDAEPTAN